MEPKLIETRLQLPDRMAFAASEISRYLDKKIFSNTFFHGIDLHISSCFMQIRGFQPFSYHSPL